MGCSTAKGYRAPVNKTTACRSDKKLGRILIDLSGKKSVKSIGGNCFAMILRDDMSRHSWEYFLKSKADAPDALEQWLADTSAHGPPGIIRSDDASELRGGRFAEICRKHTIKREFTSADRPQLNGVAERGLTLIEKLAKTATNQAKESFKDFSLPATDPLWPEAHNYACDVLNRTATSSNAEFRSPHEMLFGTPPPPILLEFLQPCFHRVNRKHKNDAQAEPAFYLGPAANHPRDCVRLMTKKTHKVVITRNATWQPVPPAVPPSSQITPVIMENEESGGEDGNSRESTSSSGGGEGYSSGDVDHLEVT